MTHRLRHILRGHRIGVRTAIAGALGLLALVVCGILRLEASYPQISPLDFELDGPGKNVDDPCFWVNPTDPAGSLIFTTQKGSGMVEVFNVVTGQLVGTIPGFVRPNNCAVSGNLLLTTDREFSDVKVHRIPDLTQLRTFGADMDEAYGIDVFDAPGGGTEVFVTDQVGAAVHVYDLPTGTLLRTFPTGFGAGIEPIAVDDRYERIYVARGENESVRGIGVFTPQGTKVGEFGRQVFAGEVEGIAVYRCGDEGYLLVSDQRVSVAEFEIFDRVTLKHLGTFKLADGTGDITNATDGIDILQTPLPGFPHGLFAACDGCGDTLPDEMDVIRWDRIADVMGLNICPDSAAPDCHTAPCVERFMASADAFVRSSLPDRNFGAGLELELERDPPAESQIVVRVEVPDLTGLEIMDATLRLTVASPSTAGGDDGGALFAATGGWTESGVTWRTRPAPVGAPIGSVGAVEAQDAVDFDVSGVVTGPGSYDFVLVTGSANKVRYQAREADLNPPTLLLTVLGSSGPTVTVLGPPAGTMIHPGEVVILSGSASDADEGDLSESILWTSDLDGFLGQGGSVTASGLRAGLHRITASVEDASGLSDAESVHVLVNTAPTLSITAPANGALLDPGQPAVLEALAADAEDGDLGASVAWSSSVAGPLGGGARLTVPALVAGFHTITATVTDTSGVTVSRSIGVNVNARPTVVIAAPASGTEIMPGAALQLSATATDPEDGNLTAAIAWTSDRAGSLGTGGAIATTLLTASGTHVLTASVTDGSGRSGAATVSVVVDARPVVAITGPAGGSEFEPGVAVVLTGTASDAEDGNLGGAIAWRSNRDGALGTGASVTVTTLGSGTHTITATVTDSRGKQGTATSTLVINARPVVAITGPASGSEFEPGAAVVLRGTASDAEDGNLGGSIAWRSDRDGTLGTGASVTVTTLRSGAHTITATVTDSRGKQGTATLALVINARPVVAITGPAGGSEFEPGAAVVLTGTASDAEDGNLGGSIAWRSDRGGALGTGASVTVTTLRSGAHTITATATDSRGKQGTATSTVVVNGRPTVRITAPHHGAVVTTDELPLLLVGEASDPEEGAISGRIAWTSSRDGALGVGASVATLLSIGPHTLSGEVADALGRSGRADISVLVRLPNLPPVVSIVAPADGATVPAGTAVTFSGHALDEDDGDLSAGLVWTSDVGGPLGSGASLTRTLGEGRHVITTSVADHQGLVGSAVLAVVILPTPPVVTIATPQDGTVVQEGDALSLGGSAIDATDGDLSATLVWSSDRDGLLGSGPAVTATLLGTGVHILRATVIDAGGLEGAAEVDVVVNVQPVVSILRPGDGAAILAGRAFSLGAVAVDVESGNLGAGLVWTSSREGALGVGGAPMVMLHTEGTHEIRATVTDGAGGEASDAVMVTVRAPTLMLSPVADTYVEQDRPNTALGRDPLLRADASPVRQMFLRFIMEDVAPFGIAAANLRLTVGATSSDASTAAGSVRTTSNHTWSETTTTYANRPTVDGPVLSTRGAAPANAVIDFDVRAALTAAGTYDFALVTSSDKAVGYRSREAASGQPRLVIELAANMPPVVDIVTPAPDVVVVQGTPLTFSATATDTEDGNVSAQIGWTSSLQGGLGSGATVQATLAPGTHVITARVTDRGGLAGSAARTVTVLSPPSVAITAPAAGTVLFADALPVSLRGSATDLEDGDLGSALEWTSSRDGALGVGAELHVGLSVGAHTITATVADSDNLDDQAAIGLLVRAANQAPVVAIATPPSGSTVPAGTEVDLAATAIDDFDGDVGDRIAWSSDRDGALGVGPVLRRRLSEGAHVLRATARDSDGALGSAERTLLVMPSPPVVTITAPVNGAIVAEGSSVTFRATALDATDGSLTAGLLWTSDLAGVLGTGGEITTSGLGHGVHRVTATVADSGGLVGDAHVTLVVNARPSVHIAAPADGTRLLAGRSVALQALASDPEDGDLTGQVAWTSSLGGPLGSGGTIMVPSLSAGTHVISARVVDSHGAAASTNLTLNVASATLTIGAIADTYVDQDSPNTVFGTQPALRADGSPIRQVLTRFSVPDLAPFTIDRARLRLTATSSTTDASVSGGTVRSVSDALWSEAATRYNNRPAIDGPALGTIGAVALNQVVEVDVTAAVHAPGMHGFAVVTTNDDAVGYRSRQAQSGGPLLVLALRHNAAPTVTVVAPASGTTVLVDTTVTLRATAFDLEQGDLSGGISWSSDRQGRLGSGASVSAVLGAGLHVVTAAVTDAEGAVGQAQVQVRVDSPPTVAILSPGNGTVVATGEAVRLRATASDVEDGVLDHAIAWASDLDGPLGAGGDLLVATLRSGVHRITADVTDSRGTLASDAVTVVVNAAPLVDILAPANGAMVTEGNAVVLVGRATDVEDGDLAAAILWSSDRDGALGSGAGLTVALSVGTHVLTASVEDALGSVGTRVITVTIVDAPPVVSIVEPADGTTLTEGATLLLLGTATDARDGDVSGTLEWTSSRQGPLGAGAILTVPGLGAGTHVITASAMDHGGHAGTATVSVTVRPAEMLTFAAIADAFVVQTAPSSRFGGSAHLIVNGSGPTIQAFVRFRVTGTMGQGTRRAVVRLRTDGSASAGSVSGGTIHAITDTGWQELSVSYQTRPAIDGPALDAVGSVAPGTVVEFDVSDAVSGDGTYVFAVVGTVNDSVVYRSRESGADGPALLVSSAPMGANQPPAIAITAPADGTLVQAGTAVSLRALATDPEDGDLSGSVVWASDIGGPLGTGGDLVATALGPGTHRITASVSDHGGGTASATVRLVVNARPAVHILTPANGATLPAGRMVALAATASDAEDGDLGAAILWTSNRDGALGSGSTRSVVLSLGTHVITAEATDGRGARVTATVTVTVADAPPTVQIVAPADGITVAAGTPVMLQATATDAEDGDLGGLIAWTSDRDGPLGVGSTLTASSLRVGTHVITAAVLDASGQPGSATVRLTVASMQGLTFGAVADAFVVETSPTSRFGASTHLIVNGSGPTIQAFVRFRVTGTMGAATRRAVVRLRTDTSASAGSVAGGTIHAITDTGWEELLVSYQTRPAIDGPGLHTVGAVAPGAVVEFDVSDAVSGDGTYVFAVVGTVNDSVVYRSRESGASGPVLMLDLQ